jgi:hypothetical protein
MSEESMPVPVKLVTTCENQAGAIAEQKMKSDYFQKSLSFQTRSM